MRAGPGFGASFLAFSPQTPAAGRDLTLLLQNPVRAMRGRAIQSRKNASLPPSAGTKVVLHMEGSSVSVSSKTQIIEWCLSLCIVRSGRIIQRL